MEQLTMLCNRGSRDERRRDLSLPMQPHEVVEEMMVGLHLSSYLVHESLVLMVMAVRTCRKGLGEQTPLPIFGSSKWPVAVHKQHAHDKLNKM